MQNLKTLAVVGLVALAPAFAIAQSSAPAPAPGATPPAAKGEPGKGPRHAHGERLKAADKDGDGAISKAEADAAGLTRLSQNFDKLDANKDGKITREEMRGARPGPHGERHGGHLKAADKDGDGAISKAEAEAAGMTRLAQNFDKLDANKDGKITREEMHAARMAHKGQHHDGKGPGSAPATPATPPAAK